MSLQVTKVNLDQVNPLRIVFLHENNFQFVYDKCHYYGWADTYLFQVNEQTVGYGAVWGSNSRADRDCIMEFFVIKSFRKFSNLLFEELIRVSGASYITCQSNDQFLSKMFFEYAEYIYAEAMLFEDEVKTSLSITGAKFGRDQTANQNPNDVDGYFVTYNGETVATGGFMLNYNIPYADIYMEVKEKYRRSGFGSFITQELKNEIYKLGRVPAARCNIRNSASKGTLIKAGFKICGHLLTGTIKKPPSPGVVNTASA